MKCWVRCAVLVLMVWFSLPVSMAMAECSCKDKVLPAVAWASFDQGLYEEAAVGFSKASADQDERGRFFFFGGISWMKAGFNDQARAFFSALVNRGGDDVEPVSGVALMPLCYAYFVKLAADSGDVDAIRELNRYYGDAFAEKEIVWLDEAMKPLGTTSFDAASRDFRATTAVARLGDYSLYQKARAFAVAGSFDECKALIEASLDVLAGKHLVNGEVRDLRQSAEELVGGARQDRVVQLLWGSDRRIWYLVAGVWIVVLFALAWRRRGSAKSRD